MAAPPAVHLGRQHRVIRLEVLSALTGERDEGEPAVLEEAPALGLGQSLASLIFDLPGDASGRTFQAETLAEVLQDLTEALVAEAVEGRLEFFLACFHDLAPFGLMGVGSPPPVLGENKSPKGALGSNYHP